MASDALAPLAQMLATLPDESVEGLLFAFDSAVQVSDASQRAPAAQLLRDTGSSCSNPARRERLMRAAGDVEAGRPCAAAPVQYDKAVEVALPPPPSDGVEEEDDDDHYMEEAPPQLPHLPVRCFFPGLAVRVGRDFRDIHGRAVCEQDLLKLFAIEKDGEDNTLSFLERTVPLSAGVGGHAEILENAGNAWFQPVPTVGCLEDLADLIDRRLEVAEENGNFEDDDDEGADAWQESIDELRGDIADCQEWLARSGERGPVPRCASRKLAVEIFEGDDIASAWIRLFFAAVPVAIDETPE
jgi:hypothetical protein